MPVARRSLALQIAAQELASCITEALGAYPYETGGLLLGRIDHHGWTVTDIVGPGPHAKHGRMSFDPDQDWQAEQVKRIRQAHNGQLDYLGDWHSHPLGTPKPSSRDRDVLRLIADSPTARCPTPIMLIISISSRGATQPRAYRLAAGRLARLHMVMQGASPAAEGTHLE